MKRRKKKTAEGVTVSGDPPAPLGSSLRPKGDHRPPRTAPSPKTASKASKFLDAEPMAPGRKLRTIRDDFPPIRDRKITLILFGTEYHPRFATTAGAKLELLDAVVDDPLGRIVAVWSGKVESHAFDVTDEIAARWVMELADPA